MITGSTRGIGFGLADNLLRLGQKVLISGRSQGSVERALNELQRSYPGEQAAGYPCDVQDYNQLKKLWDFAVERFREVKEELGV